MKVYLAGKMDEKYGAWRDSIIEPCWDSKAKRQIPRWEVVSNNDLDDIVNGYVKPAWPKQSNRYVLGLHEYVGPYRLTHVRAEESKWFGYFHGSTWKGSHGLMDPDEQQAIVDQCVDAIHRSDLFFAYLNSPDCFGTLTEIGIARALGKYVYVVFEDEAAWDWGDYWFSSFLADCDGSQRTWDVLGDAPPVDHGSRALGFFKDALIRWTARDEKPAPLALVQQDASQRLLVALAEAANSFAQIGRWSADPRVRNEAQRMLKRIAG